MYAFCHAQSVDRYDFTYSMRRWMRDLERAEGTVLSGIFVASSVLKELLLDANIGTPDTVHTVGFPFNSDRVREQWPNPPPERKRQVVFSSRWDSEKRPELFIQIMHKVLEQDPTIRFVVTTSARTLRSNEPELLKLLWENQGKHHKNLQVRQGASKTDYYSTLLESAIQINTADQDWISITLLEAGLCGCRPLYPYFRSFPSFFGHRREFMYAKGDPEDAARMILEHIDDQPKDLSWIYQPSDRSWFRMLEVMNGRPIMEPINQ